MGLVDVDAPYRSVALVLGGGGVTGAGYHAGALAALAEAAGWDARTADLVVGTSAGSGIAASLRMGFSPADHLRRACDEPMSDEGAALAEVIPRHRLQLPARPKIPLWWMPSAPWLAPKAFIAPGAPRLGLAWAGLSPRGRIDSAPLGDRIRAVFGDEWPAPSTWICALRLSSGTRTVFGRDPVRTPDLGTAVQASSAVPSFFAPVKIGGHAYVDGGAWSATNADLVAGLGFDVAVVIAPMALRSDAGVADVVRHPERLLPTQRLHAEVGAIETSGTRVVTLAPAPTDLPVMRGNPLDNRKAGPVARMAYESISRLLSERADLREALAPSPSPAAS